MTKVYINKREYKIDSPIDRGGEGEVYNIEKDLLAKIYHNNILHIEERRLKVLALCNAHANNFQGSAFFAFPIDPAYENLNESFEELCGFSMKYFRNCPTINEICYDLSSNKFRDAKGISPLNDDTSVKFIYNIFDAVEKLHKARIILGDVNPKNILYNSNTNQPVIIDIDSAQFGQFNCLAWSDEYLDPLIQQQGKNCKNCYTYNYESDIFSVSCICYELFVGTNPFYVLTRPAGSPVSNKQNGISLLRYMHSKENDIDGIQILKNSINDNHKKRLCVLKEKYENLYNFFVSVFLDNHRINLMQTLDRRKDPRHPAYIFYSQSGFYKILNKIISQRRQTESIQQLVNPSLSTGRFSIPSAGFSHVIDSSGITQNAHTPLPKQSDPDNLRIFLEQYSSNIIKLIGSS